MSAFAVTFKDLVFKDTPYKVTVPVVTRPTQPRNLFEKIFGCRTQTQNLVHETLAKNCIALFPNGYGLQCLTLERADLTRLDYSDFCRCQMDRENFENSIFLVSLVRKKWDAKETSKTRISATVTTHSDFFRSIGKDYRDCTKDDIETAIAFLMGRPELPCAQAPLIPASARLVTCELPAVK